MFIRDVWFFEVEQPELEENYTALATYVRDSIDFIQSVTQVLEEEGYFDRPPFRDPGSISMKDRESMTHISSLFDWMLSKESKFGKSVIGGGCPEDYLYNIRTYVVAVMLSEVCSVSPCIYLLHTKKYSNSLTLSSFGYKAACSHKAESLSFISFAAVGNTDLSQV